MASCRVVKGGWSWKSQPQEVGAVIRDVSPEWVQNRVNDGLVVPIADEPVIEQATATPAPERAVAPRGRKKN